MCNLRSTFILIIFSAWGSLVGCQSSTTQESDGLVIERLNPESLVDTTRFGYTQVVTAKNGTLVFIAGQGPTTGDGKAVGRGDWPMLETSIVLFCVE